MHGLCQHFGIAHNAGRALANEALIALPEIADMRTGQDGTAEQCRLQRVLAAVTERERPTNAISVKRR